MNIKEKFKVFPLEAMLVDLLSAYALGSSALLVYLRAATGIRFSALEFSSHLGFLPAVLVIGGLFVLLTVLRRFFPRERVFRYLLFCAVALYFSLLCFYGFNPWFCAFLYIICAVTAYYCFGRTAEPAPRLRLPVRLFAAAAGGAAFLFIALETSMRYANMAGDNYDMGIYAQVFDSIAKTGSTLIKSASPEAYRFDSVPSLILYPLTLLWMIFHNMYPFLLLQAAALCSGVIPLLLILKKRCAGDGVRLTAAAVYFLYPGLWNGAFYDFHEQCLLAPFILWALYFAEKNRIFPFSVFAVLTAAVGAEGSVIALFFGLFLFFAKKDRAGGVFAFCAGLGTLFLYFATSPRRLVPNNGVYGGGSFFTFLLKDPGYLLNNLLNGEKLPFTLLMLLSLGCLPFFTKRRGELILLAPALILNLFGTDYDASVSYQHAFGASVLLLYVFVGAFEGLGRKKKRFAAAFCVLACLLTFTGQVLPRAHYVGDRVENAAVYRAQREAVALIPEGASVTASPKFVAFLTKCGEIHLYYPAEVNEDGAVLSECNDMYRSDYSIFDLSGPEARLNTIRVSELLLDGFEVVFMDENAAAVLKR
ncbi:MAG: DUF2079 domain-containing protein [Clostridia bacterium]|nr:DUF2079 domain-containing protein [Clostridia bacterium]